jgi:hypothetical protein
MKRIQRKRTKGWKAPPNTVFVHRPLKWGNPFRFEEHGREWAVEQYRQWLLHGDGTRLLPDIGELRGKNLGCFCPLDGPCHADVLLDLANKK